MIPGLVDSHTHVAGLGANLERVDLTAAEGEAEAVELAAARAAEVPAGEWIVGWGWDEGAWANRYPDKQLLTQAVPDHPVFMGSLHGFAGWGNQMALDEDSSVQALLREAINDLFAKRGKPTIA